MANVPTTSWDETSPAGSQAVSLGDDRIREMKTQTREVIGVDHKFASSGNDADGGKHNKVSLLEQADLGTGANGKPILGAQTANSKAELIFTDEDDNDIQITKAGKINSAALAVDLTNLAALMAVIYPIGTVLTFGVSTNPATLLGIGTWTAITGKVIVGIDSGTFTPLDATGGAETVTLTSAQSGVPAHTHDHVCAVGGFNGGGNAQGVGPDQGNGTGTRTISANVAANAASAHTNLQPYIVKYVWQRTA